MKFTQLFSLSALSLALLSGCQLTSPKPAHQKNQAKISNNASNALVAKSTYNFKDKDIKVPAYFDTQGLENCNFNPVKENEGCSIKKAYCTHVL